MTHSSNQPKTYDVVLGGKTSVPLDGAVLGGLPAVKRRLMSSTVGQRLTAVKEALKYGQDGLELVIQSLNDPSWHVQRTAYLLLQGYSDSAVKLALQEYNPYQLFECLYKHSTKPFTAYTLRISPDGQLLISCGNDKMITIRSLQTGRILRKLEGHLSSVYDIAVTPDGQTLVSCSSDHTIKVWNIYTALTQNRVLSDGLISTLRGHSAEVNCMAISPGGNLLASGSNDQTIQLWDLSLPPQASPLRTLTGHSAEVNCIALSPDGQILASGSADETIQLWNLSTGENLHTLTGHQSKVRCLAITPDGQLLASGSDDRTIKLWHLPTGELQRTLTGHWSEVNSLTISPDGQTLMSASSARSASVDKTIRVWHLETGKQLHSCEGHLDAIASVAVSLDGQKIVSSSWDETIRVWGIKS